MIVNRFIFVLCAASLAPSMGAGLRESGQIQGRRLNAAYNELVELLYKKYDGGCKVRVESSLTYFHCTRPGSYAILTSDGAQNPIPKILQECRVGSDDQARCLSLRMTGNTREDLQHASVLLHGLITPMCNAPVRALQSVVGTDYDMMIELLNGVYANGCSAHVTGLDPSPPTTYAYCFSSKGYATLTADGSTNPVPKALDVCHSGDETEPWCQAIELTGKTTEDILAAKKILGIAK